MKPSELIDEWVNLVKQVIEYEADEHSDWFIDDFILASTSRKKYFYEVLKKQKKYSYI